MQVLVPQGLLFGDLLSRQAMLSFSTRAHQLHQGLSPLLGLHHCLLHSHQQDADKGKATESAYQRRVMQHHPSEQWKNRRYQTRLCCNLPMWGRTIQLLAIAKTSYEQLIVEECKLCQHWGPTTWGKKKSQHGVNSEQVEKLAASQHRSFSFECCL